LDGFDVIAVNTSLQRGLDGLRSLTEKFVSVKIHAKSSVVTAQTEQFSEW